MAQLPRHTTGWVLGRERLGSRRHQNLIFCVFLPLERGSDFWSLHYLTRSFRNMQQLWRCKPQNAALLIFDIKNFTTFFERQY